MNYNDNNNHRKKTFKNAFVIFFFFVFFHRRCTDLSRLTLLSFRQFKNTIFLNCLEVVIKLIRKIIVVEIREIVFQSILFVNLDVVVKLIRKLAFHNLKIFFSFF